MGSGNRFIDFAPRAGRFLLLALADNLPKARRLVLSAPLTAADGGEGGDYTLSVDGATASARGIVKLTGQLGGTADAPDVLGDDEAARLVADIANDQDPSHRVTLAATLGADAGGVVPLNTLAATTPGVGSGSVFLLPPIYSQQRGKLYLGVTSGEVHDTSFSPTEPEETIYRVVQPANTLERYDSVQYKSVGAFLFHELTHARRNQLGINSSTLDPTTHNIVDKRSEERFALAAENRYRRRHNIEPDRKMP